MKHTKSYRMRFLIMIAILVVCAIGYFTIGGIGNVCGIGFDTITLLCPLGALLAMIAERTAIPLAVISVVVVLLICVVLGKVFCSWVCPVHFLSGLRNRGKRKDKKSAALAQTRAAKASSLQSDATEDKSVAPSTGETSLEAVVPAPLSKSETAQISGCATCAHPCGKSHGIKIDSRHGILAAALGSTALFGFPVFCLICPVGLTFATVLLVMRLFALGDTTWTVVVFPLIIALEILLLPKWCQHFCPLGALLSLFSGLNKTFRPKVDASKCLRESQGHACNLCEKACPEGINLHDIAAGATTLNDCSKCRACAEVCPGNAISFPLFARVEKGSGHTVEADPADSLAEGR